MEYFAKHQKSRPRGHLPHDFSQNDKRLSKEHIHLYDYFPIGKPGTAISPLHEQNRYKLKLGITRAQRFAIANLCPALVTGEAGASKGLERAGAMRQGGRSIGGNPMFFLPRHFAKSSHKSRRQKYWIVAEAQTAARRENEFAENLALKTLRFPVRKGEGEGAHKIGLERRAGVCRLQRVFDFFHGRSEIAGVSCPARGIYARSVIERRDAEA